VNGELVNSIIECIPNVSEGRRVEIVESLATVLRESSEITLLDYSADPSHHRSVFTFAGDSSSLAAALIPFFERAIAAIDLRVHRGEHPRIGAVDVVPFVPLVGATMADAVRLAMSVAAAVAERFQLPVYLYEEASENRARRALEDIRRGGFEGLSSKMNRPGWRPDFGPSAPHPTAGASVVGARPPLIAYNVNLASDRLDIATAIAAAIRTRGGGLPAVKALGLSLAHRGVVQVSMNLTDYRRTSIADAFNRVRAEAGNRGVAVLDSQIVGLIPKNALRGVRPEDVLLKDFNSNQILENRIPALRNDQMTK
jgi:glutamate formiminotransferase